MLVNKHNNYQVWNRYHPVNGIELKWEKWLPATDCTRMRFHVSYWCVFCQESNPPSPWLNSVYLAAIPDWCSVTCILASPNSACACALFRCTMLPSRAAIFHPYYFIPICLVHSMAHMIKLRMQRAYASHAKHMTETRCTQLKWHVFLAYHHYHISKETSTSHYARLKNFLETFQLVESLL